MDSVIHLAATPIDAPLETLLGPNVLGVHAVLRAAREEGARRVVLASTIQTVGRLARERRVTSRDRAPSNNYALTKVWAEEMGTMARRVYGLEVVVARIAWMVRNAAEAERMGELGFYDVYLSPGDAARFFRIAIEAPTIDEPVMFVAGPESGERVDLEPARRLGFVPRDRFPEGLDFPAARKA
jgi:nucleoside-diphosphate-sugar epimerase